MTLCLTFLCPFWLTLYEMHSRNFFTTNVMTKPSYYYISFPTFPEFMAFLLQLSTLSHG